MLSIALAHDNSHSDDRLPPAFRPRKVPFQARAHNTVDALLDAAAHILIEAPEALTTNEVADRAGVSIGSLYQYFPNKDSILAALMRRQASTEAAFVLDRLGAAQPRNLKEALCAALDASLAFREQDPALQQALLSQLERIPQFPGWSTKRGRRRLA